MVLSTEWRSVRVALGTLGCALGLADCTLPFARARALSFGVVVGLSAGRELVLPVRRYACAL